VIAVCSNKGGVGKTTVSANLAIYLRALQDSHPVLLVGLDDQSIIDRMFRLEPPQPGEGHLKHGWAERSFDRVIRRGRFGVYFVPPPPDTALLKARAQDPETLRRILDRTEWRGVVILDTKSDLEALTLNALHAADRVLLPVADRASLEEAAKVFTILERSRLARDRARIVLTLVDRRTRVGADGHDLHERLEAEIARQGWPRFRSFLSRSPRLEALNSATVNPGSILHHARGTQVHAQMRALAEEVMADLGIEPSTAIRTEPALSAAAPSPRGGGIKRALLRGLRGV
jgi:cellulose biosynthesis protein BcsQ